MNTLTIVLCSLAGAAIVTPSISATAGGPDPPGLRTGEDVMITVETRPAGEADSTEIARPFAHQWAPNEDSEADLDDLTDRNDPALLSNTLEFDNFCGHPLRIAVYAEFRGRWYMHAWYYFDAYEGPLALPEAQTDNRYVYWYAETTDGSGWVWEGGNVLCVENSGCYGFREWNTGPEFGTFRRNLFCN